MKRVEGFSKLSKQAKLEWVAHNFFKNPDAVIQEFKSYWHNDEKLQKLFDEFSENTLTNFYMPYNVAPNFMINGKIYAVPMVIEESSVVAAAAGSAKFWLERGGFHSEVISTVKIGQVHFSWRGDFHKLKKFIRHIKPILIRNAHPITRNMEKRGGGILDIELINMTSYDPDYYQLKATFETCESMGANFINSVLENFAATLTQEALVYPDFTDEERDVRVIMSILSNYTPDCIVRTWVECPIHELGVIEGMQPEEFATKFAKAIKIAKVDVFRAATHNKGIMNGADAVVIATGNDFRATEACAHVYAARSGRYQSLSDIKLDGGKFHFAVELPMALGVVGGLTTLHPLVKLSLEMLGNPTARELMMIASAVGLANNFSAVKSMTTVGIQKGHMKMHLLNILKQFEATEEETEKAKEYFKHHVVSYAAVRNFLISIRPPLTGVGKK
ncbi:MAG: 3-hydroxy-3-methylglutaryl coenzyme A reductase [Chitinophagales bacterium]|nr:MAG: 3-hydroxy-3-methylglutaryl coenzyme A reductase [Chitinophagales bacterium]